PLKPDPMKKLLLANALLLLICPATFSQHRTEDFNINLPEQKIAGSFYKTIRYLDARYDTTNMGIVQLGAFNKKAKVVPKIPFANQLTGVMNSLTDSTAKDGELLFQLRQFSFAEVTSAMSEKGYCYLRATLFFKTGERYKKLHTIDTVILIKSMDVTGSLFRNGSRTIVDFIANNLLQNPAEEDYFSFSDIVHIDSIEKLKMPVYNTEAYADGLYASFASFTNQTPDKQITAELKNDKLSAVKSPDENGKLAKVKPKNIYAVVYKGQPFIATAYGYYPLQKTGDDFFFTGKAKVTASTGDVIAASLFFGIIGSLIASDAEASFEMKIDHANGGFIRLREIKTNPEAGSSQ
ncbi:MAG TPA: hypothetical protein VK645_06395, partial [Chitinophagaceae bacterium]|nr:hypothetical protein [Chitinophagaceae bacterium]